MVPELSMASAIGLLAVHTVVTLPVVELNFRMDPLPMSAKNRSLPKKAIPSCGPEARGHPMLVYMAGPSLREPHWPGIPRTVDTVFETRSSFLMLHMRVSAQYREEPSGPRVMLVGQASRELEAGPSGDHPITLTWPATVETLRSAAKTLRMVQQPSVTYRSPV